MLHALLSDDAIRALLKEARTIAIIGAKDKAGQPVDDVGRYLIAAGYKIIPVHPTRKNVWGLPTYAKLEDVPDPVDIVDVFRASEYCPEHARETVRLASRPSCFWMQLGISNPEASALVEDAGILSVSDKCIKIEHALLVEGPAQGGSCAPGLTARPCSGTCSGTKA